MRILEFRLELIYSVISIRLDYLYDLIKLSDYDVTGLG